MPRTPKTADAQQDNQAATGIPPVAVEHIAPAELLIDVNVRLDPRVDKDFTASIREHGVLQPVIAVRTNEGGIRVRFGHRRTLAALEAGLPTVPVVVVGDEASGDAGSVERLVQQYAENEHRAGLTDAEHVQVVAQLTAFGISPAQIAKRTRMTRTRIDAALTVSASDLAKAATVRYDLTIDQAAVVAEFENDTETVKALVAAARSGQFNHVAQRARDERTERAQAAEKARELTEAGIRVIDRQELGPGRELSALTDEPGTYNTLTRDEHTDCPGHAAYLTRRYCWDLNENDQDDQDELDHQDDADAETELDEDSEEQEQEQEREPVAGYRWEPVWVCTNPTAHGHVPAGRTEPTRVADMDDEQREAAREQRRDVIDSNKAWESAETVRRDWLRTYLTRKTAPKNTATFLARAAAQDAGLLADIDSNHLAADLLGVPVEGGTYGRSRRILGLLDNAADARAQVIHLALTLAAYEDTTTRDDWRRPTPHTTRYFNHLRNLGYTLSPVESRAVA